MEANKTWFILLRLMKPNIPFSFRGERGRGRGHILNAFVYKWLRKFLEGPRKENAANQIKKKSQVIWDFRVEWEIESEYKRKMW